jgi:hypothetical protein
MSTPRQSKRARLDDDGDSVMSTGSVVDAFFPRDEDEVGSNPRQTDDEFLSQDTNVSNQSRVILNQREREDDTCTEYLRKGFMSVSPDLRNAGTNWYAVPLEIYEDEHNLLKLSKEHEVTMDSVSKSFQLIPSGHDSNYMQPYEAAPLCYVERCNSMNIPGHIANVIYFYYSLLTHIKAHGMTGNAIPIESMSLKKMKNDKGVDAKKIVGIFEDMVATCVSEQAEEGPWESRAGDTTISRVLCDRDTNGSDHLLEREPFTIRLAFTGAFFEVEGETRQELFCVAIVTPLKAFNLISYIKDYFTMPPKPAPARDHWCQMDLSYKKIQMFEANNNCGLTCDPARYSDDIGGKGGILSVLSMLNLPLRIAWIIRNLKPGECPENIRIIGMPKLTFKENGTMHEYLRYMHAYINEQVELHAEFERNVKVYYSTQEPEQSELSFTNIRSPGGWPLKTCTVDGDRVEFQRFGLFPFPLVMAFNHQRFVDKPSKESFLLNLGQEPDSVVKKKRDFATFDQEAGVKSVMPDSAILLSTELSTPLSILEKYYGPNAKPAEEFKDTKLIKWYEAMRSHVQNLLAEGEVGPDEAMVQIKRHLDSCMEQHTCILKHDSYGSFHFEQCGQMVDKMLDTKLATVSVAANLRHIKEAHAPRSIRHDTYLSASFCMLQSWVQYNKHACLYATNSEAALDILLSGLLWHLGSHSHTMTSFFQGTLLVSMRGHLEVLIDKLFYIDWRKPNSSGAGAIQERLNQMMEELGRVFKITPDENNVVFVNPNRNTMAALENECCVITINTTVAEVKSKPSPDLKDKPVLMLENRGDYSLDTLLRFVFPRDGGQKNFALTTMDLDNTNNRSIAIKKQVANPNVCGFCTNQKKGTDEPKSLICVTHVADPGAPAYYKISDQSGEINRVQCELSDGRATMPSETELYILLKQIFFSKVFTSVMVALPHRAGMFPFKINQTSSAFLDWLYMVLRSHLFCVFNTHMIENFGRIKVRRWLDFCEV